MDTLIKDQENSFRRTADRTIEALSIPPVANSINDTTDVIDKPALLNVFDHYLPTDNTVSLGVISRGTDFVTFNTGMKLDQKDGAVTYRFVDDFSVHFRRVLAPTSLKLQLRGDKVLLHTDFDQHLIRFNLGNEKQRLWVNPYVALDTSRFLNKFNVHLGCVSHWDNINFKKNSKIVLHQLHSRLQADLVGKFSWRYRGFFVNALLNSSVYNPLETADRELLAGVEERDLVAAVSLRKSTPGSYLQWNLDRAAFLLAYNLRANGIVGAELSHTFQANTNPALAVAYQNRVARDLFLKAKVDTNLNAALYTDYALDQGVSVQAAVKKNFSANTTTKGFLDLPFLFGVKLMIDR